MTVRRSLVPAIVLTLFSTIVAVPVATAVPIPFSATLTGPAESPPVASPGIGTAFVAIDPVAHTLFVDTTWSGLVGLTTVSHIHVINGPADLNLADTVGPIATTTPTFPGFPAGVTAGTYQQLLDTTAATTYNPAFLTAAGGTTALAEAALFSGIIEGRAYFNIHSDFAPTGEIRGFLVPEPSMLVALATGLIAAAIATRSTRARRR